MRGGVGDSIGVDGVDVRVRGYNSKSGKGTCNSIPRRNIFIVDLGLCKEEWWGRGDRRDEWKGEWSFAGFGGFGGSEEPFHGLKL